MYEINWKLTIKTTDRRQWRRFGMSIVNFKQISHIAVVFIVNFKQVNSGWVKSTYHSNFISFTNKQTIKLYNARMTSV